MQALFNEQLRVIKAEYDVYMALPAEQKTPEETALKETALKGARRCAKYPNGIPSGSEEEEI